MTMTYAEFIESKRMSRKYAGFKMPKVRNSQLFDYQDAVLEFAVEVGRSACFLDTGL